MLLPNDCRILMYGSHFQRGNWCACVFVSGVAAALKFAAAAFFVCVWFLLRWKIKESLVSVVYIEKMPSFCVMDS